MHAALDDYRWLVSPEAAPWLAIAVQANGNLVAATTRLRKQLSAPRTHLVLEQAELRQRARRKFTLADQMFFTPVGLEQASDSSVAAYKARRFAPNDAVMDLCCGIGGDLLALAQRGPTTGVDRDEVCTILAEANLHAADLASSVGAQCGRVITADVSSQSVVDCAAWHIDPDRRPTGRRTTRVELAQPGPDVIDSLRDLQPSGAVKLAPASEVPENWRSEAELEWISRGGECRQLVAWFGRLAQHGGQRCATVVDSSAGATSLCSPSSAEAVAVDVPGKPLRYLFEPDAAVLAAELIGQLAAEHSMRVLAPGSVYLTSDEASCSPLFATFDVQEVLPLDLKRIKALVRERGIGQLEVKKRGVEVDPAAVQKQLRTAGDERATLILTRIKEDAIAILARRIQ